MCVHSIRLALDSHFFPHVLIGLRTDERPYTIPSSLRCVYLQLWDVKSTVDDDRLIDLHLLQAKDMRLSWPTSQTNQRQMLTNRGIDDTTTVMAETPVSYEMPSSPGSMSTTNDAATLIASPDQPAGRNRYEFDQLETASMVSDDDEFEQRRQLLHDVTTFLFKFHFGLLSGFFLSLCAFNNKKSNIEFLFGLFWIDQVKWHQLNGCKLWYMMDRDDCRLTVDRRHG